MFGGERATGGAIPVGAGASARCYSIVVLKRHDCNLLAPFAVRFAWRLLRFLPPMNAFVEFYRVAALAEHTCSAKAARRSMTSPTRPQSASSLFANSGSVGLAAGSFRSPAFRSSRAHISRSGNGSTPSIGCALIGRCQRRAPSREPKINAQVGMVHAPPRTRSDSSRAVKYIALTKCANSTLYQPQTRSGSPCAGMDQDLHFAA
jgi:hypothetical protein